MAKRARMPDSTVVCSICVMPVRDDALICPLCGVPLEGEFPGVECRSCSTIVLRTLRICPNCGAEVPKVEERPAARTIPEPAPPPLETTVPARERPPPQVPPRPPASPAAPPPPRPSPEVGPRLPGESVPGPIPYAGDIAGRLEEAGELVSEVAGAVERKEWSQLPGVAESLTVTLDSISDLVALSRQAREPEPGATPPELREWVERVDRAASLMRQEIAELGLAWVRIGEREALLEPRHRALREVETAAEPPEPSQLERCQSSIAKLRGFHASRSETDARASLGALRKSLRSLDAALAGREAPAPESQPLAPGAKLDAAIWESESSRLLADVDSLIAKMGATPSLLEAEPEPPPPPPTPPKPATLGRIARGELVSAADPVHASPAAPAQAREDMPPPPPIPPAPRPAPRRPHRPIAAQGWQQPQRGPALSQAVMGRRPQRRAARRTSRAGAAAFGATVVVVLVLLMIWAAPFPRPPISVDGDPSDWSGVPAHVDARGDGGGADSTEFRATYGSGRLFALARVADPGFGTVRTGTFYLLVDGDGSASTGISHRGLGCELMARVVVDAALVASATSYRFEEGDATNWSGFVSTGTASAAFADGAIEVGMGARGLSGSWRASLALQDASGALDLSDYVVAGDAPSLRARLAPAGEIVGTGQSAARLTLEASGGDVAVASVKLGGTPVEGAPLAVTVKPSSPSVFDLKVAGGAASPGDTVDITLESVSAAAAVSIDAGAKRASSYFGVAPQRVRIDGAFADWSNASSKPDPQDQLPQRLDIRETRSTNTTEAGGPAFLVGTAGIAMMGDPLPSKTIKPAPGPGGGPVVLPRIGGEDSLLLYLDVGPDPATGFPVGGIGADYLISVTGNRGSVESARVSRWNGVAWGAGAAAAADASGGRVEVGAAKSAIDWAAGPGLEWHAVLRGWDLQQDSSGGPAALDPIILLSNGSAYRSTGGAFAFRGTAPGASGQTYSDLATDGASVYALRTDGAVYSSADQGATWGGGPFITAIASVSDAQNLATDGAGSFYAMRTLGEFYSCVSACGGAWSFVRDAFSGSHVGVDLAWLSGTGAAATFYAIRDTANTQLRTGPADGTAWSFAGAATGTVAAQAGVAMHGGSVYVLDANGLMRASSDAGANWANLADQPPACSGCYKDMSVDPSNGRIFISQSDGSTYYWDQGGGGWVAMPSPGLSGLTGVVYVPESAGPAAAIALIVMTSAMVPLARLTSSSGAAPAAARSPRPRWLSRRPRAPSTTTSG